MPGPRGLQTAGATGDIVTRRLLAAGISSALMAMT